MILGSRLLMLHRRSRARRLPSVAYWLETAQVSLSPLAWHSSNRPAWTRGFLPIAALRHAAQPAFEAFLNSKSEKVLAQGVEP